MEYSLDAYRRILERALATGFRFRPFETPVEKTGAIYLRHDVDFSLDLALEVARVNASLGVPGTFFVLARSNAYNVFGTRATRVLDELVALGQRVGLHATTVLEDAPDARAHCRDLRREFDVLRAIFPALSPVFSWHNPTPAVLEACRPLTTVEGLTNAYAATFMGEIPYVSDANMRHGVDALLARTGDAARPSFQLLLHPCLWAAGGSEMREAFRGVWRAVLRAAEHDIGQNKFYRVALPAGMPEPVLDAFVRAWSDAVAAGPAWREPTRGS